MQLNAAVISDKFLRVQFALIWPASSPPLASAYFSKNINVSK